MLRLRDIGRAVLETRYAVRGEIVARADELERQGRTITYCNIGNPQALGQAPLTWIRQVLALFEWPELADRVPPGLFPADVLEAARRVLAGSQYGPGAYSESKGYRFVRDAIAEFIEARDGIPADAEAIYLTDGASKGVQSVLRLLISDDRDGILIPIPQYPLYSATITLYGGAMVPYELDEEHGWGISQAALERAVATARAQNIRVRAIVVINPGNPTGGVLDEADVARVLAFAREHDLTVLADEVYQENVYAEGARFVSFASVLVKRRIDDVSLFSFHSTSKGYLGECGHRGGYVECRNVPDDVMDELTKLQSVSLCANSIGQVITYLLVRPPRRGEPSFATWDAERRAVLDSLRKRAELVAKGLDAVEGISCVPAAGAMYAFPRITLPPGVTDHEYCLALLEETGICVVPGSGFGQVPGTAHFRTTILPPIEQIEAVVARIARFHRDFTARHRAQPSPRPERSEA